MAQTFQLCILLIALAIGYANSARHLDELASANPFPTFPFPPSGTLPSTATATSAPVNPIPIPPVVPPVVVDDVAVPSTATSAPVNPIPVPPVVPPVVDDDTDNDDEAIVAGPAGPATSASSPIVPVAGPVGPATSASASPVVPVAGPVGGATSASASPGGEPTMSFFMHDIVGGSHPTARMVTGLVASAVSNVAFTKPNNNIFPVSGGVPLTTSNVNGFLNSNRNSLPLLAGLNGQQASGFTNSQTSTVIQNSGNNNIVSGGTSLPFVAAGQLPAGAATLQKLMFGSITVIDDELTEDHELGSAVLGRAQGFYLASSLDGNSHTMVLTVICHGSGEHHVEDTISLFGVHRTATLVSHVAVIGGTGKFENAQGYATVESLPQVDQHTTDGVDTIMHVSIYLSD